MTNEQKESPSALMLAAQGLLSAWDSANANEKYDECIFEAFSSFGAIERLRDAIAEKPVDLPDSRIMEIAKSVSLAAYPDEIIEFARALLAEKS